MILDVNQGDHPIITFDGEDIIFLKEQYQTNKHNLETALHSEPDLSDYGTDAINTKIEKINHVLQIIDNALLIH